MKSTAVLLLFAFSSCATADRKPAGYGLYGGAIVVAAASTTGILVNQPPDGADAMWQSYGAIMGVAAAFAIVSSILIMSAPDDNEVKNDLEMKLQELENNLTKRINESRRKK